MVGGVVPPRIFNAHASVITDDKKRVTSSKSANAPSVPKSELCHIPVLFGESEIKALVDTGASYCVLSYKALEFLKKHTKSIVKELPATAIGLSASGDPINFHSRVICKFKIGHLSWKHEFHVSKQLPIPVIIGSNFLTKTRVIINMANHTLAFPYGTPKVFSLLPIPEPEKTDGFEMGTNLNQEEKEKILRLVSSFPDTISKRLGRTNLVKYHIRVKSDQIFRSRPFQYAPPKLAQLKEHISELLQKGIIRPSDSQFASPAFLVPKKGNKTRMVVDYRKVNSLLELDCTPVPCIESAFQHLGKARLFSILDLNQAYNQIPLDEPSKQFTSFVVPWGQYEFNFLPFGLASGSMVLTSLIDRIFGDIKFKFIFNFFDDLCIYTDGTLDDHLEKVREVVSRLQKAGLTVNPQKMTIAADRIQFLGHTFTQGAVTIHSDRTRPIDQFPTPRNQKQLARFLGMTAFYARFIKDYAVITQPLNQLKRKDSKWTWGPEQQQAFTALKAALVSSPVLKLPDFSKRFVVHSDASGSAVGAVLSQEHDGQLLPVAFASRALNKHELNYTTLQLECLAVVFAFQKFQQYLEHREFDVHTDCSALTWLLNHPRQTGKIARWITFINSFQFNIAHIKGKDNNVADCLSRLFENSDPTTVESSVNQNLEQLPTTVAANKSEPVQDPIYSLFGIPEAFKDISKFQVEDPDLSKIIRAKSKPQNFTVQQGILLYQTPNQHKPRVVVPSSMLDLLFRYYHEAPNAAHLGVRRTLAKITPFFWSENLKQHITDRIKACVGCQRCKQAQNTQIGTLSSEIVTRPWEKIFIDHIGPLPRSTKGNVHILSIVDAFSKFSIFIPVRNTKAQTTINALSSRVFSIFGSPKFLVSDNVSHFRSRALKDFCLEFGIQHIFTSPYKPSSNMVERYNKEIKTAIRIFHNEHQSHWDQNIHWFQLAFNTAHHESINTTPARLLLGRSIFHPLELSWNLDRLIGDPTPGRSPEREWAAALTSLRKARSNREARFNAGRYPNTFKVGDWVMYRLHHLSSKVDHVNSKLLPMWSKPCVIESFSSPVSVRLVNPSTGKLVRKAHITQLKKFFQPNL